MQVLLASPHYSTGVADDEEVPARHFSFAVLVEFVKDNASVALAVITALGFGIGVVTLSALAAGLGVPVTDLGVELRGTIVVAATSVVLPMLVGLVVAVTFRLVSAMTRMRHPFYKVFMAVNTLALFVTMISELSCHVRPYDRFVGVRWMVFLRRLGRLLLAHSSHYSRSTPSARRVSGALCSFGIFCFRGDQRLCELCVGQKGQ